MNGLQAVEKWASSFVRIFRYGRVDEIKFSPDFDYIRIRKRIDPGHYKNTTGQKVPNAYLKKFGWKNTHHLCAYTEVSMPLWAGWLAGEDL